MDITQEDLGNREVRLTVHVDEKQVEQVLRGVARRISKEYNIPGFRRGRAPFRVILQRFGRETLLNEALDDLGQEVFKQALGETELEPYAPAELEDVQLDPLVFTLTVPLQPVVDLGDYRALRVEPPLVSVDEEEVEKELEQLRQENAVLNPVDRPAQMDDQVTLSVEGWGEEGLFIREDEFDFVLDPDARFPAPGFVDEVVGMELGEEKAFTLTFPEDYDLNQDLAGQEADFTVELLDVRTRTLPGFDDDLARTVGDYDSLDELREEIRQELLQAEQRQADETYLEDVMGALIDQATIEYPLIMVEAQLDDMLDDLEDRMASQGLKFEDQLKLSGQTEEGLRQAWWPQAEESVRRGLVLQQVILQERLAVDGEEIDERINVLSESWGQRAADARQMLSEPEQIRSIASNLLANKAVERLMAIAKGEAPPLEEEPEIVVEAPEAEEQAPPEAEPGDESETEEPDSPDAEPGDESETEA